MTPASNFTDLQLQAARLAAEGLTTNEVAEAMGVSPRSAKAHLDVVRHKLRIKYKRQIGPKLKELELL